ncbi:lysine-specific histone demethylase [Grosmannia clavigera kw1407]|uniref:Lysine-specific histone demethylase n=1 Tax=Grosmannia clavigera (strain kw1407 / UAMH 11150) TaxID=655863 RepID=F0XHG1_GROCL|nr:lysine-specific histone demethylase [Grosmannia clavigera kw1407]EFX03272.1 lysine-specific histone demethylase [Grosmannia clavigera kw1407]
MEGYEDDGHHGGDVSDDSTLSELSSPSDMPDDFKYFALSPEYNSIEAAPGAVPNAGLQPIGPIESLIESAETATGNLFETPASRASSEDSCLSTANSMYSLGEEESHTDMEASIEDSVESFIEVYAEEPPSGDDDERDEPSAEPEEGLPDEELPEEHIPEEQTLEDHADRLAIEPAGTCPDEATEQPGDKPTKLEPEKARPLGHVVPSLPPLRESVHKSLASSVSAITDRSELYSIPSLASSSSKATTPIDSDIPLDVSNPSPQLSSAPASMQAPLPQSLRKLSLSLLPDLQPPQSAVVHLQHTISSLASVSQLPASPVPTSPKPSLPIRIVHKVRPKSSIPADLSAREYARQCVAAAESSRLNPYALDEEERMILRQHISHAQVTTYLNIRNGILRLWVRRPQVAVTRQEAIGCAKDNRWFDAANVCFHWLVRRGFINFGCAQIRGIQASVADKVKDNAGGSSSMPSGKQQRRKRIIVIGAGLAGLGCARQLDSLFKQYTNRFLELGKQPPPDVVVLEGRSRIGGRVYSRPFQQQQQPQQGEAKEEGNESGERPVFRCTAEMGGMIITGFDRGNPLNVLVRGQLGLPYHALWSETTIHDTDGKPVDSRRDGLAENLFNECLDRVSEYKFKTPVQAPVEGNRDLMDEGRDSSSSAEGHRMIAQVEDAQAATAQAARTVQAVATTAKMAQEAVALAATQLETLAAKPSAQKATILPQNGLSVLPARGTPGVPGVLPAAYKVQKMGWDLRPGVVESRDLHLDAAAKAPGATLGFVIDEAIRQYQEMVDFGAKDFRLLNWHIANLEYSTAINHSRLSLQGWDIDAGNEWEGKHSRVIGGYQSVPRGLMLCPTPLNLRRNMIVTKISYSLDTGGSNATGHNGWEEGSAPVIIECEGGYSFEADYVVNTIPLGVLKHGNVEFEPPLPEWKTDVIRRLGYGVLNKVILTFPRVFWDPKYDIFGVLREPSNGSSLDQQDYSRRRGSMFQGFNVTTTTGLPCLLALMAGDAAYDTETSSNDELVAEAMAVLRSVFGAEKVPAPAEAVVTRWASDPFARGSYSSAGPEMRIDDYDVMARSVGRHLLFAGEHTTGAHPATVHGAYLSGLRAASELIEELLGPIDVPVPLVIPREMAASLKRKAVREEEESAGGGATGDESGSGSAAGKGGASLGSSHRAVKARLRRRMEEREQQMEKYVQAHIGERPLQPARVVDTSYLLFSKANYERARKKCEETMMSRRKGGSGNGSGLSSARALPNDVRVLTSKMWRSASADERRPYAERASAEKQAYVAALEQHRQEAAEWDRQATVLRSTFAAENSDPTATVASAVIAASSSNSNSNSNSRSSSSMEQIARSPSAMTLDKPEPPAVPRRLRRLTSQAMDADNSDVDMTG